MYVCIYLVCLFIACIVLLEEGYIRYAPNMIARNNYKPKRFE